MKTYKTKKHAKFVTFRSFSKIGKFSETLKEIEITRMDFEKSTSSNMF